MDPKAILCTKCGYSAKIGRQLSSVVKSEEKGEERVLMTLFGEDYTIKKTIGLGMMIMALVGIVVWWITGPGASGHVLAVEPVNGLQAIDGVGKEKFSAVTIMPGMGEAPSAMHSPFTLGHADTLTVVRHNLEGDHLIVKAEVAQRVMVKTGKSRANAIRINAGAFRLNNADGTAEPVYPVILDEAYDRNIVIDIVSSQVPHHDALLPVDSTPAEVNSEYRERGISTGTIMYDGTNGVDGALRWEKFPDVALVGSGGFTAEGKLTRTKNDISIDFNYAGPALEIKWREGAVGWRTTAEDKRSENIAPTAMYEYMLLFPRPRDPSINTLWFEDVKIGRLPSPGTARIDHPTFAAVDPVKTTAGGERQPITQRTPDVTGVSTYFHLLAKARRTGASVASVSNMRQIGIAIMMYTHDHNGQFPNGFNDLAVYLDRAGGVLHNQRTGERPGYIYVKPKTTDGAVRDPSKTAVLFESLGGKRDPNGAVLYLDGRIEMKK